MVGKGFRCTLRSDDGMMPSKELKNAFLGRKRKEKEEERIRRKEGRGYSIEDFLPTANNIMTRIALY